MLLGAQLSRPGYLHYWLSLRATGVALSVVGFQITGLVALVMLLEVPFSEARKRFSKLGVLRPLMDDG